MNGKYWYPLSLREFEQYDKLQITQKVCLMCLTEFGRTAKIRTAKVRHAIMLELQVTSSERITHSK